MSLCMRRDANLGTSHLIQTLIQFDESTAMTRAFPSGKPPVAPSPAARTRPEASARTCDTAAARSPPRQAAVSTTTERNPDSKETSQGTGHRPPTRDETWDSSRSVGCQPRSGLLEQRRATPLEGVRGRGLGRPRLGTASAIAPRRRPRRRG